MSGSVAPPPRLVPTVGQLTITPQSWHELIVGDLLVSSSGTKRTIQKIEKTPEAINFHFLTERSGRPSEREVQPSTALSLKNLREVIRASTDIVRKFKPSTWKELATGDILHFHDGSRRIIAACLPRGDEGDTVCIARNAQGAYAREEITLSPSSMQYVAAAHRWEPGPDGGIVRPNPIEDWFISSLAALLGQGERGKSFAMNYYQLASGARAGSAVDVRTVVDDATGEVIGFGDSPVLGASHHEISLRISTAQESPTAILALFLPETFPPKASEVLRHLAFLANSLRGVSGYK